MAIKTLLDGRFEILACLGQGGMSDVYLANQLSLSRKVVVKIIKPGIGIDQSELVKEAKALSQLNHENIVHIYDSGIHDEAPFIIEEYIDGISLRDFILALSHHQKSGISSSIDSYCFAVVLSGILSGLRACHQCGIIHRDIKPENILLAESAQVRIVDFGLARSIDTLGKTNATLSGGTIQYMAPECFSPNYKATPSVDIYSVGCIAFELLALQPPFNDLSLATILNEKGSSELPFHKYCPDWLKEAISEFTRLTNPNPQIRMEALPPVEKALLEIKNHRETHPGGHSLDLIGDLARKRRANIFNSLPTHGQSNLPSSKSSSEAITMAPRSKPRRSHIPRIVDRKVKIRRIILRVILALVVAFVALLAFVLVSDTIYRKRQEDEKARQQAALQAALTERTRITLSKIQRTWNVTAYKINNQYVSVDSGISLETARDLWLLDQRWSQQKNQRPEAYSSLIKQYNFRSDGVLEIKQDQNRNGLFESNEVSRNRYTILTQKDDNRLTAPNQALIKLSEGTMYPIILGEGPQLSLFYKVGNNEFWEYLR